MIEAADVVGVQVALSWHIMNALLPLVLLQLVFDELIVQLPTTTPLLRAPVVVVVPLEVPVRVPFRVSTLSDVVDLTVRFNVPVTVFVEVVVKFAEPDADTALLPVVKHAPELKKPNPVMSRGPLFVTVKLVTKFKRLV